MIFIQVYRCYCLPALRSSQFSSTNITLNASGQFVAELRYTAFGEVRFADRNTPTDYRYTGQLEQRDLGLYFYKARFYDPVLGRFISPDTIVPGAGNPQAFDRYAYTQNNPLNRIDPTGHCDVSGHWMDDSSAACTWRTTQTQREAIYNEYVDLQKKSQNHEIDDLEALVSLVKFSASLTPNCTQCFVDNLGAVLTGVTSSSPSSFILNNRMDPKHYVFNTLYSQTKLGRLSQRGFDPIFKDSVGQGDQSRHFWFYVQVGFHEGNAYVLAGNVYHEILDNPTAAGGKSYQDFALGIEGGQLGSALSYGGIQPMDVGQYIQDTLSKGSWAAFSWEDPWAYGWHEALQSPIPLIP